jgi:hypothetical protein
LIQRQAFYIPQRNIDGADSSQHRSFAAIGHGRAIHFFEQVFGVQWIFIQQQTRKFGIYNLFAQIRT